jgi:hypothetical protein
MNNKTSEARHSSPSFSSGGFETHPAGTAERLRRLNIIGPAAADLLEEEAKLILESETTNGEFDASEIGQGAKETYETFITLAAHLRALCDTAKVVLNG